MSDPFFLQTIFPTDNGRSSNMFIDSITTNIDNLSDEANNVIRSLASRQESRLPAWIEPDGDGDGDGDIPSQVNAPSLRTTEEPSDMSISSTARVREQDHGGRSSAPPPEKNGGRGSGTAFPFPLAGGDAASKLQERYDREQARRPDEGTNRISFQGLTQNYVCWSDGPQNQLAWNAVFVCPISGECFATGTLVSVPYNVNLGSGWYGTKKMAIKAAAGRAEDCFKFRDNNNGWLPAPRYCSEEPYRMASADASVNHPGVLDIPGHVPDDVQLEIRKLQNKARGGVLL